MTVDRMRRTGDRPGAKRRTRCAGRHGFDTPDPSLPLNLGAVMLNSLGRFMTTEGGELPDVDPCLEDSTCGWIVQSPP